MLGLAAATVAMSACDKSVTAPVPAAPSSLVAQIVTDVYLPTFDSLDARCARLATALQTLSTTPTTQNLLAAQSAWRTARISYENNEGFAFGPIETEAIDPNMDTWPVDRAGIATLLAGSTPLTPDAFATMDGTLKGFHGIEDVLFGDGGSTTAASLTARQLQYLASAGQDLSARATSLHEAWSPEGGNFAGALTSAGTPGAIYPTVGSAIQEIVNGLVDPTDEVANSKIALPLQSGDTYYEESAFSDNTIADLTNDLRGAQAAYLGGFDDTLSTGKGISAFVAAQNAALDQTVRQEFSQALAALAAVGPSFDTALHNDPEKLHAAQNAILTLNHTLVQQVVPLVGASGAEDGD